MRWYGLLIGMVLTLAEYCAIGLAATARHGKTQLAAAPLDRIWYGGTLDAVVVEATTSGERQALTVTIAPLHQPSTKR